MKLTNDQIKSITVGAVCCLEEEKGLLFRCTAACGGGIGWLSELERVRRVETVSFVGGIMNGTCNYILDSMTRLGLGYDEALGAAQPAAVATNMRYLVAGIYFVGSIIMFVGTKFIYNLDKKTLNQMTEELNSRKV